MSVRSYGAESYTSIGDSSHLTVQQAKIVGIANDRARIITCISACLSPITCPIWCVEGTMLSCSALIRKLLAPDGTDFSKGCYSCYFFCGGCFCELCRWQFACCYPKPEPDLQHTEKEECSPCTRLVCSVFYPFHACHDCPSPWYDLLGALPLGGSLQDSPWSGSRAYCLPGPEREAMRDIARKMQKAQNIQKQQEEARKAEARKKKTEEAQIRKAQHQREEEARKQAAEEARIRDVERRRQEAQRRREEEQERQAEFERSRREDPMGFLQTALLIEQNELLREGNELLRQQAAARSAQPSG